MSHFGDYQNLLYGRGLQGVLPKVPVDLATLEERAQGSRWAEPKARRMYSTRSSPRRT